MAKAEFDSYGKKKLEHFEHTTGSGAEFVSKSGGPIDPYGDMEKKDKSAIDMNAAEAFAKKDYTKIEAMGTDYPKASKSQVEEHAMGGDHFSTDTANESIDPYGTDCGKSQSFHTIKRK